MKLRSVIIYLLNTFVSCNLQSLFAEERIVGGRLISIKNYPYHLSLLYRNRHVCGAALINKTTAITGAHCIRTVNKSYSIRAGSSTLNSGGKKVAAKRIIVHPRFTRESLDYDVALIILNRSLHYNEKIYPIKLSAINKNPPINVRAVVTGWGITEPGDLSTMSKQLRGVSVFVMSQEYCKERYGSAVVTRRMFCAGYKNGGKDACQGDSGGPLVANGTLIGIVSWGIDCADSMYPGVYVQISKVRLFIKKYTGL